MTIFKGKSLEGYVTFWLALFATLFFILAFTFMYFLELKAWQIMIVSTFIGVTCVAITIRCRHQVMLSFKRALMHLDSIKREEYKQYAKPLFSKGVVDQFYQNLRDLSNDLSAKKQRYDQHAFLVYRLIDQLDTPVMVFNDKGQLAYANGAFSLLYEGKPWQSYRYASTKLLGLLETESGWQLVDESGAHHGQWQISHSTFIDLSRAHRLLIFTNVESAIRNGQLKAWQQMINVMGHEIRNSLTPVCSIAENLALRAQSQRDQEALELISERCLLLQDFINRYASLTKQINLNYEDISAIQLAERVKRLLTQVELNIIVKTKSLWADKSALEQVLINLVKNAYEACAQKVTLDLCEENHHTKIRVIDDGHGFANLDNFLVPLFTTKPEGQGIGLSLCRNIIEQHHGNIKLANNQTKGVTITITLPLRSTQSLRVDHITKGK